MPCETIARIAVKTRVQVLAVGANETKIRRFG
jgi:hypothetical protein